MTDRLDLTAEDMADLIAGHTINVPLESGPEIVVGAPDGVHWGWADDAPDLHLIIQGNPIDGFAFHGPFATADAAIEWADAHRLDRDDWWQATLVLPAEG